MALREEFCTQGNLLFRFRSHLPLLFFFIILLAIGQFKYLGDDAIVDQLWEMFCLSISFLGMGIRANTIGHVPNGTSGRNTAQQIADVLNTTGIYSIVRHPLYLGNFFMWLGVMLFAHSAWLILTFVIAYCLYYERIMYVEEEFLRGKFGTSYLVWAEQTPAFWPKISNWKSSNLTFSWRQVIKREYHGLFGVIIAFTLLEAIGNYIVLGNFELDWLWRDIFTINLIIYIIVRFLAKKTYVFHVEGR